MIELLVVIALVGLLVGVLVTLVNPATQLKRARDTQRKSDLSRIQSAIEIYRGDLGAYPCFPGPGCMPSSCGFPLAGGGNTYMTQVPCDPLSPPTIYIYAPNVPVSPSRYCLRACLENQSDAGRDNPNNFTSCQGITIAACPAGRASYTVQNP